jgi:hypothetical protein
MHDEVIAQVCDRCWGSGKDPCCKEAKPEAPKMKVIDLFEALRESLQETGLGKEEKAELALQELHRKAAALRELEAEVAQAIDKLLACPVTDSERSLGVGLGVVEGGHFVEDLDVCCADVLKAIAPLRKRVGK